MVESNHSSEPETVDAGPQSESVGDTAPAPAPATLGRYRILERLGSGGFGMVFKAYDEGLQRLVAVKVPHAHRVTAPKDVEAFLAEARTLASLDHPGIVPVHDVGRTDDGLCYVVSKFIEGCDLRARLRQAPLPVVEAVEIVARVAEAVHHAHRHGLVHRDIKPGNILLDRAGIPYLADFGLALREENTGQGPVRCGTPGYMSPEQARGESHLVNARSDVYSLGVVLFELLVGRLPFTGTSTEIAEQTRTQEPPPPRQCNPQVPRELDRVCLKALALRASDRYSSAADLADDLRHWQTLSGDVVESLAREPPVTGPSTSDAPTLPGHSEDRPLRIVPRGLRAFDESAAGFFLELLPGSRDRDGLPESIRFWKTALEQLDPERAFRVGLVYGPSGCGKSSLVKAGLLPRLSERVLPVYLEATAGNTEARLLRALRKRCPNLPGELGLAEAVGWLRRARGDAGRKVVIVLDQLEQWLQGWRPEEPAELVQALRQCDGQYVQALLLVRDDFWMAATRFLRELEVRLVEGRNSAAVELFDPRHARKVLAAYGRAFGALPDDKLAPAQEHFLDQAAAGLTRAGKVVSVHLSLFAEMIKGQPWTPATLKAVGGPDGIGVAFLEETLSAPTAPPGHRLHEQAARTVLGALLPKPGTAIKGHMRSRQELLVAAGYTHRPGDFEELLEILDKQLRLVTPTEPEEAVQIAESRLPMADLPDGEAVPDKSAICNLKSEFSNQPFYQLTHDYLVQPVREWLTRKQKETWRGRARLRLEEWTALWSPTHESRFLPALPEFLALWFGVPPAGRTPAERALMRAAGWRHGLLWGVIGCLLLLVGLAVYQQNALVRQASDQQAAALHVDRLLKASPAEVPQALRDLEPYAARALPLLRSHFADGPATSPQRLHAAFGLAHFGEAPAGFLMDRLAEAPPSEAGNLLTALGAGGDTVRPAVWQRFQAAKDTRHRARYASTLLHLGETRAATQLLALDRDPTARAIGIDVLVQWHGDLRPLATLLPHHPEAGFQSGLCATLGMVDPSTLGVDEREELATALADLYRLAPENVTHSTAGWALGRWQRKLPELPTTTRPVAGRDWFVNRSGLTMLRMPPGRFTRGDAKVPDALPHQVTLTRSFFVSDREIFVDLFRQFMDDPKYPPEAKRLQAITPYETFAPRGDCPAIGVSWVQAVLFCNWLSQREGRQPCYTRTKRPAADASGARELEVWTCDFAADGYRLPTEAEWEFACRAGTVTAYSFGDAPGLLPNYGVFYQNSQGRTWPGGTKLPNAWGLFDMHGNVEEWCWDWFGPYDRQDQTDPQGPPSGEWRVARGGNWYHFDPDLRSAGPRVKGGPTVRSAGTGFRVVFSAARAAAPAPLDNP